MKKSFIFVLVMVLLAITAVPVFADAKTVPENPDNWLQSQEFIAPTCNPQTYEGWVKDQFDPSGGQVDHLDVVALPYQTVVVWGNGVSVNGTDYGRSLVSLEGGKTGGRWAVVINNGAHRPGTDTWGFFPKYWQKVLVCLYKGEFPITVIGNWITPPVPATAEEKPVVKGEVVISITSTPTTASAPAEPQKSQGPVIVGLVCLAVFGLVVLGLILGNRPKSSKTTLKAKAKPAPTKKPVVAKVAATTPKNQTPSVQKVSVFELKPPKKKG